MLGVRIFIKKIFFVAPAEFLIVTYVCILFNSGMLLCVAIQPLVGCSSSKDVSLMSSVCVISCDVCGRCS